MNMNLNVAFWNSLSHYEGENDGEAEADRRTDRSTTSLPGILYFKFNKQIPFLLNISKIPPIYEKLWKK